MSSSTASPRLALHHLRLSGLGAASSIGTNRRIIIKYRYIHTPSSNKNLHVYQVFNVLSILLPKTPERVPVSLLR